MMECIETDSGLVIPKPFRAPKTPSVPALQIRCELSRKKAAEAFQMLWEAMNLGRTGIVLTSEDEWEAHYKAYRYLGEMLLGDDLYDGSANWQTALDNS